LSFTPATELQAGHDEGDRVAVIPEETLARVLASTEIVELISSYLPLKPAGRSYKALCPFHSEKTPSFIVTPGRQIFHCFGCGEGGDAIGFVMRLERLSFPEAVRFLADRAGISLPGRIGGRGRAGLGEEGRLPLFELHKVAAEYFRERLSDRADGAAARAYLREREIPDSVVERFGLGYAPAAWEGLLRHLLRRGFTREQVEQAGLALARKEGSGVYDRFRGRVMVPICDAAGKVIAFGGRALDGSDPKYLNSPETAIYKKGGHLFGLHLAATAIRETGSVIVVEGYFDLITLHARGFQHSVAVLGTALTGDQIALLRRYAARAFLVFDPDPSGIAAARRSAESLLNSGLDWRVTLLPEGADPDRFLRERGAEAFRDEIDRSRDLVEFLLDRRVSGHDLTSLEGQVAAVNAVLPLLGVVENELTRERYAKQVARRVALSTEAIVRELRRHMRGRPREVIPPALRSRTLPSTEWRLIHLALHHAGAARRVRRALRPEDVEDPALRRIFECAFKDPETAGGAVLLASEGPEVQRAFAQLLATDLGEYDGDEAIERALDDCVERLRIKADRRTGESLQRKMTDAERAGDHAALERLQAQFMALKRERGRRHGQPPQDEVSGPPPGDR
jgi:DNA primase